jgi:hypothetical protein
LAAIALFGCDVGAPSENARSRSFDRPLLQVGTVLATVSYDVGVPVRARLEESALTDDVEASSSFEIFFDRFLWPKTVTRQAACLHPSTTEVNSIADCAGPGQPFTQPEYNPVRRSVTFRLVPGARLKPSTQYRLTVFTSGATSDSGFFAFDGAPLARSYRFDFKTKGDTSTAVDELPLSRERYCSAQKCAQSCAASQKTCKADCKATCANDPDPKTCEASCKEECGAVAAACKKPCGCIDGATCAEDGQLIGQNPAIFRSCGFSPCHSQGIDSNPALAAPPALGLDLSSPGALAATALGSTAHLSQTGEGATQADASGARFGRAMPLIDPSNPGNSFLLYKLLINARNFSSEKLETTLSDDIDRLRAGAIPGIPMPAAAGPGTNILGADGPSSEVYLELINNWIAAGAVLSCE